MSKEGTDRSRELDEVRRMLFPGLSEEEGWARIDHAAHGASDDERWARIEEIAAGQDLSADLFARLGELLEKLRELPEPHPE